MKINEMPVRKMSNEYKGIRCVHKGVCKNLFEDVCVFCADCWGAGSVKSSLTLSQRGGQSKSKINGQSSVRASQESDTHQRVWGVLVTAQRGPSSAHQVNG